MATDHLPLTEKLRDYVLHVGAPRDAALLEVERETAALGRAARMQTAPEQAAFLELLVAAIGAREIIEVGTFTGYGAIRLARGLPPDGRLLCLELSEEYAATARANLAAAGVADRAEVRVGPALDALRALPAEPQFDLSYLDADKRSYPDYYEELVPRTRPNGLILVDNTLQGGRVLDPGDDENAVAVARLNERISTDDRVTQVLLPVGDGLTIARVT